MGSGRVSVGNWNRASVSASEALVESGEGDRLAYLPGPFAPSGRYGVGVSLIVMEGVGVGESVVDSVFSGLGETVIVSSSSAVSSVVEVGTPVSGEIGLCTTSSPPQPARRSVVASAAEAAKAVRRVLDVGVMRPVKTRHLGNAFPLDTVGSGRALGADLGHPGGALCKDPGLPDVSLGGGIGTLRGRSARDGDDDCDHAS